MQFSYDNFSVNIDNPNTCPHCHVSVIPTFLYHRAFNKVAYTVWACPSNECKRTFIAVYEITGQTSAAFTGFLDGSPIAPHWPTTIQNLRSKFISTYVQALKAENLGLDELSGMGFRKAIEYLVKDYLIQKDSSLEGKIEDLALAKIIIENFNLPQESDLKDLLQRATWLGNDLTHYLRYHDNFDINDLKELVNLVMDEIHSIEQKRHYIANIQNKYPKKA